MAALVVSNDACPGMLVGASGREPGTGQRLGARSGSTALDDQGCLQGVKWAQRQSMRCVGGEPAVMCDCARCVCLVCR